MLCDVLSVRFVELQVVAVAARNLQRAEEFAQKHNIPTVYGSYEELARDPNIGMDISLVISSFGLRVFDSFVWYIYMFKTVKKSAVSRIRHTQGHHA